MILPLHQTNELFWVSRGRGCLEITPILLFTFYVAADSEQEKSRK